MHQMWPRRICLICLASPVQVVAMLKERGLENMSLVVCDPWSVHMAPSDLADCKLIQLFMYFRTEPNDNHYAHPLDFTPIVDLYQKKVTIQSTALTMTSARCMYAISLSSHLHICCT